MSTDRLSERQPDSQVAWIIINGTVTVAVADVHIETNIRVQNLLAKDVLSDVLDLAGPLLPSVTRAPLLRHERFHQIHEIEEQRTEKEKYI